MPSTNTSKQSRTDINNRATSQANALAGGGSMNAPTNINQAKNQLTPDEMHLVQLFRKMGDRSRRTTIGCSEGKVERNPRHIAPVLRLIVGGAA